MTNQKFEPGDILHLVDSNDPNWDRNSLFEVIAIISEGYVIRSLRSEALVFPNDLSENKNGTLKIEGKSPKQFMEDSYRLATQGEIDMGPQ